MDPRFFLDAAFAVAAFFAAFWIRSVKEELIAFKRELHELVRTVANHGERIAVLESRIERLDK